MEECNWKCQTCLFLQYKTKHNNLHCRLLEAVGVKKNKKRKSEANSAIAAYHRSGKEMRGKRPERCVYQTPEAFISRFPHVCTHVCVCVLPLYYALAVGGLSLSHSS